MSETGGWGVGMASIAATLVFGLSGLVSG